MRLIKKIWWTPLLVYMIIIPVYMSARMNDSICREIKVSISDSMANRFVTAENLFSIVHNENNPILGANMEEVDIAAIEQEISAIRELEKIEVYETVDGVLHIEADQRDPVLRVISSYGASYYIDKFGMLVPYNQNYTPRIIVVSGSIDVPDSCISGKSVRQLSSDNLLRQAFEIIEFVSSDEFWKRQFEQLYVNSRKEFEFIPRIGNHIIKFGDAEGYVDKFESLKAFYMNPLSEMGWNKYSVIDLRYSGQIVCKKI